MNIAEREQQILRVKAASFQPEMDTALEKVLPVVIKQLALNGVVFAFDAINTQKKLRINH